MDRFLRWLWSLLVIGATIDVMHGFSSLGEMNGYAFYLGLKGEVITVLLGMGFFRSALGQWKSWWTERRRFLWLP